MTKWRSESRNGAGRNGSYIFQRFSTSSHDDTATSSCPKIRCSVVSNCASSAKLDAATYLNWSERQCGRSTQGKRLYLTGAQRLKIRQDLLLQRPNSAVRAVRISMIARLPKLPMLIAKTSRVFLEKYRACSTGRSWQNCLSVGVKHGRGLRFDEGSATAVRGRSQGLIPGRQATYNNFRRVSSSSAIL